MKPNSYSEAENSFTAPSLARSGCPRDELSVLRQADFDSRQATHAYCSDALDFDVAHDEAPTRECDEQLDFDADRQSLDRRPPEPGSVYESVLVEFSL
jgi:hypothetical protein